MLFKVIAGLVAIVLALVFYSVPIFKLKEIPLIIVVLIGVAMMVYEFIETVREKEEE